jgi:hypothetical protein
MEEKMANEDKREKERRGRPKTKQRMTPDGKKDMRGRPGQGQRLYKTGTK